MMKKMVVLVVAMLAVIVVGAVPALADEVQNQRDGSSSNSGTVGEKPLKDPGIRQCDITPPYCKDTHEDSAADEEEPLKDPGIRKCDITPPYCKDNDHSNDPSANDDDEPFKDPGIRQCDVTPPYCKDTHDDPRDDDHGHNNSGAHPDAVDPNKPVEEKEESKEEATSAPGVVKAEVVSGVIPAIAQEENDASVDPKEAVSAPADEAGQAADSGTIHGCPFDYDYHEEIDVCLPPEGDYEIFETIFGDTPWPDSVGGYVGLLGDLVEDPTVGVGTFVQLGLGYVEEALLWYGEDGGPIGWGIQGVGYALGFTGDAAGAVIGGVGEAVGAVADGVGEAIDAVGDAAGSVYDEVSSWF
jgi:hypothetical protein